MSNDGANDASSNIANFKEEFTNEAKYVLATVEAEERKEVRAQVAEDSKWSEMAKLNERIPAEEVMRIMEDRKRINEEFKRRKRVAVNELKANFEMKLAMAAKAASQGYSIKNLKQEVDRMTDELLLASEIATDEFRRESKQNMEVKSTNMRFLKTK